MKKITYNAAVALAHGREFKRDNTHVCVTNVRLHGNEIARRTPWGNLEFSLAGWPTRTTCERVNGLLEYGGLTYKVRVRNGQAEIVELESGKSRKLNDTAWYVGIAHHNQVYEV